LKIIGKTRSTYGPYDIPTIEKLENTLVEHKTAEEKNESIPSEVSFGYKPK
jgi:hypothetical protein